MNPFGQQTVVHTVTKSSTRGERYAAARKRYRLRVIRLANVRSILFLTAGVFSAGFGLEGFLLPNRFIDGGATGIALLLTDVTGLSLSYLLVLVNIPFIFLAYKQVSKIFAVRTILAIVGLALVIALVRYPVVTDDKLLIAVFGGFFLGAGTGLAVRGGGVLDGSEVLAIYVSRKTTLSVGEVVLIFNILLFGIAAVVLSPTTAMYAIITYFVASKTVDFIIEGIEEYTGVTIISRKNEEIIKVIREKLEIGFTIYKGVRGFGKSGNVFQETNILFTVVTRLEVSRLKTEIQAIDPKAFVIFHSIRETKGGMIKRKPLKKL
jgi:uncharacterized membrane-anchored protein YitT (DUF2179 family)